MSELAGRLGIFARTFRRDRPEQVAAAVAEAGYPLAHWNFAAIGRSTLAEDVEPERFAEVRQVFAARGIGIPSVSATYNVAHPDPERRRRQTLQAIRLIGLVPALGADVVTLCSGTRDPENIWRAHPDNRTPEAWRDLRAALDLLLPAAAAAGVRLGIEPEPGNIVADAPAAARLLAELPADASLGIVLDPANLLTPQTLSRQFEILAEAVELLGDRVISVQAKDVVDAGYSAAGAGAMDYPLVFQLLERIQPVPLIVQDAREDDAARVRNDLLRWYAQSAISPTLP